MSRARLTRAAAPFRTRDEGEVLVVADAHLTDDDPAVADFCRFLLERGKRAAGLVMLGDIFSLWLGAEKLTRPCQRVVLEAVQTLRSQGTPVGFVEGNREIGVSRAFKAAFDASSARGLFVEHAGRRWFFSHGDRARSESVRERVFRTLVRSRAVQSLFFALPARAGLAAGGRIERTLRGRNLRLKASIRRASLEEFASRLASEGIDAAAIGHLHVEMRIDAVPGRRALVVVLPDWRSDRRFLRISQDGGITMDSWGEGRPLRPAIVEVVERATEAEIVLDGPGSFVAGAPVVVSSGHGPDVRRGRVLRGGEGGAGSARITLGLEAGPPLQAGDRVECGAVEGES